MGHDFTHGGHIGDIGGDPTFEHVPQAAHAVSNVPAQAVTPDMRSGMSQDWIIGPLEIAPGDLIQVVYSSHLQ
jgi:hypothetical protein